MLVLLTWYLEWQKSVLTAGFEVIFQELQNWPELCYQFSQWSRDIPGSLTSCRVVEGKNNNSLDSKLCCTSVPGCFPGCGDSPTHEHSLVPRAAITA